MSEMKQFTVEFHAELTVWAENEFNAIHKAFHLTQQSGNAFLYPTQCRETPPVYPMRIAVTNPKEEEEEVEGDGSTIF